MKNNKGFTLIELLVVISIISLLSSVVLAALNGARAKSSIASGQEFSTTMYHSMGDTLAGYWNFNSDTKDYSGNGNDLTALNTTGCPGGASLISSPVSYSGSGSELCGFGVSSTLKGLPTGTNGITAEAWVYPTAMGSGDFDGVIVFGVHWNSVFLFALKNLMPAYYNQGSVYYLPTTAKAVQLNKWSHIAITISGNQFRAYINGNLTDTVTLPGSTIPIDYSSGNLCIGSTDCSGRNFPGYVDDVRVYSTVVTAQQIKDDYFTTIEKHRIAIK